MAKENKQGEKRVAGRKPKADPAVFRYGIKLNSEENGRFEILFQKSGMSHKAKYIKARSLDENMKAVIIDKATMDYYIRLTNFYRQFQAVGNNYNQTVRAVQTNFGEKRARVLLRMLEKATLELVLLCRQIVALTREYEERYLKKQTGKE